MSGTALAASRLSLVEELVPEPHEFAAKLVAIPKFVGIAPPDLPYEFAGKFWAEMYVDNRRLYGCIPVRKYLISKWAKRLTKELPRWSDKGKRKVIIAAVATGAIGLAFGVAHELDLEFRYVRKEEKTHGTGGQIEGGPVDGAYVILFEDHFTIASSSAPCVKAIQRDGGTIEHIVATTSYDLPQVPEAFAALGVRPHVVVPFNILIGAMAHALDPADNKCLRFTADEINRVVAWQRDPESWTAAAMERLPELAEKRRKKEV